MIQPLRLKKVKWISITHKVNRSYSHWIFIGLIGFVTPLLAVDEVPNEPPYVQVDEDNSAATTSAETIDNISDKNKSQSSTSQLSELPSPRPGVRYMKHPDAAKGLLRIEKDGRYIYKSSKIAKNENTFNFRIAQVQPPDIVSDDGATDFKTMYTNSNMTALLLDYEWKMKTVVGELGAILGFGFFSSTGPGHFKDPSTTAGTCTADCPSKENYNFYAFPISAGVLYRLNVMKRQWVAPYVSGGATYFGIVEARDDGKKYNFVGSPAVYGAAGAMFNITAASSEAAFTLDHEYGVSNMWLTGELRVTKSTNADIDLSSNTFSLGISIDF